MGLPTLSSGTRAEAAPCTAPQTFPQTPYAEESQLLHEQQQQQQQQQ